MSKKIVNLYHRLLGLPTLTYPIFALTLIALIMITSGYYNFGAEGIIVNSIQRMLDGLPYLSGPTELPLALTTYGPLSSWLFYPINLFFSPQNIHGIGTVLRIIAVVIILLQYTVIRKSPLIKNTALNILFFLYVTFLPDALLSFKPDSLSFLFEILGFIYFQKHLDDGKGASLLKCTFFLALGFLIKLNTIGIGVGLGIYLLSEKKFKNLFVFSILIIFFSIVGFTSFYLIIGDNLYYNLFASTKSYFNFNLDYLFILLKNLIQFMLFPLGILSYLSFKTFKNKSLKNFNSYFFPAAISFLLAFLGQFKSGAFLNYFFGVFLVLIPMAAPSFNLCFPQRRKELLILVALALFSYRTFYLVRIAGNNVLNYPWEEIHKYLEETKQKENPHYYVPGNNSSLFFYKNNLIGSSSEVFLRVSPLHSENTKMLSSRLSTDKSFDKVIIVGSKCGQWKPTGLFKNSISEFVFLEKKIKKICIFSKKSI